ncbi:MAG: hypothetical protein ACRCSN_02345, partial [Dermatophilaceae bacterium]
EPARLPPRMTPAHPLRDGSDLEPLAETLAILADSGALRRLAESDAELARGEGESEEQLADVMTERRRRDS